MWNVVLIVSFHSKLADRSTFFSLSFELELVEYSSDETNEACIGCTGVYAYIVHSKSHVWNSFITVLDNTGTTNKKKEVYYMITYDT